MAVLLLNCFDIAMQGASPPSLRLSNSRTTDSPRSSLPTERSSLPFRVPCLSQAWPLASEHRVGSFASSSRFPRRPDRTCQRKVEMSGFLPDRNVRFHGLLQGCFAGAWYLGLILFLGLGVCSASPGGRRP